MFTGIILATGRITTLEESQGDLRLAIDVGALAERLAIGDSVCVQGVCLTVARREAMTVTTDVSRETLSKTTLGTFRIGTRVNLEPSLRAGDALGGHLVSGHVDAVGRLRGLVADARSWRMEFELEPALMRFLAQKGSICVDGVSLTVNAVHSDGFEVNIIPHTLTATTLGALKESDPVNIEIDLLARYIDRLLPPFTNIHAGRSEPI